MAVEDFGIRLKKAREQKGLSKSELGKRIGVTGTTIKDYEENHIYPRMVIFVKILEILNISADYVLGFNPPYTNNEDLDLTEDQLIYIENLSRSLKEEFRKANNA